MATLYGTNDRDSLHGTIYRDFIYGLAGNDILGGDAGNDYMDGGDGHDRLDGGIGNDSMIGGSGNDIYYVDSMSDTIFEFAGQGTDIVYTPVDTGIKWLPNNVENLTLYGTATYGDGNDLNNIIRGTNNINYLYGHDGHDTLQGIGGNDFLLGGNGNDKLDGGLGSDWMYGGAGDDSYYVDKVFNLDEDKILESANERIDTITIANSVDEWSYYLPENVENLVLRGTIDPYVGDGVLGNDLDNYMINSNANDSHFDGKQGDDTLIGNIGRDDFNGSDGNDTLIGNAGDDRLYGFWGNDILDGGIGNDIVSDVDGNDTLRGGDGNDVLNGGIGVDILWGGISGSPDTGADLFVLGERGTLNADVIMDFNQLTDTIVLGSTLDKGLPDSDISNPGIKGLSFVGDNIWEGNILSPVSYFEGAGLTGNDHLNQLSGIYVNTTTGEIWYNPTNNSTNATDAEIIGRVSASVATSLDNTDFLSYS